MIDNIKKLAFLLIALSFVCANVQPALSQDKSHAVQKLEVVSTILKEGQPISMQYTSDGKDLSVPLQWNNVPAKTRSFAIICDDPDAPMGTFTHWVIYDIPATSKGLAAGVYTGGVTVNGAKQGYNSFGKIGYSGPKPPPGKLHRYFFHVFALDNVTNLPAGATKEQLLAAIKDHILGQGDLMGTYRR